LDERTTLLAAVGMVTLVKLLVAFLFSIVSWRLVISLLGVLSKRHLPENMERPAIVRKGEGPTDQRQLSAAQLTILWPPLIWLMLVFPRIATSKEGAGLSTASLLLAGAVVTWLIIFIYNLRFKG
jgi:hypothetical protein